MIIIIIINITLNCARLVTIACGLFLKLLGVADLSMLCSAAHDVVIFSVLVVCFGPLFYSEFVDEVERTCHYRLLAGTA
jgi:hypothetical protein